MVDNKVVNKQPSKLLNLLGRIFVKINKVVNF